MSVNANNDLIERLRNAKPLEVPTVLLELENQERMSSTEIIDMVNEEFKEENSVEEKVVVPLFTSVVDGVLAAPIFNGVVSKLGLSATQITQECMAFSYEQVEDSLDVSMSNIIDSQMDYRAEQAFERSEQLQNRPKYDRSKYEDPSAMGRYKKNHIRRFGQSRKRIEDEYRETMDITAKKDNPDRRRVDPKGWFNAETDHIVPLEKVYSQLKRNVGLSDDDIKVIANQDYNLAVTARFINNPIAKGKKTNEQFVKEQRKKMKTGEAVIDESTAENMLRMSREAHAEINAAVNKTVLNNLIGKGTADSKERREGYEEAKQNKGDRHLSSEEKAEVDKKLSKIKTGKLYKTLGENAAEQVGLRIIGNITLFTLKPLCFEIKDMLHNGVAEGVGTDSAMSGIIFRVTRIRNYVMAKLENWKDFIGQQIWGILKDFIACIAESIIGMFVGIVKQIIRVIKEGVKLFTRCFEIMRSRESSQREKGDAILKVLGGGVIAIAGITLDALFEKCGLPEDLHLPLSTILSGVASVLLFYFLDSIDLFNVKEEHRHNRIVELFEAKSKEIDDLSNEINQVAVETLRKNRLSFESLILQVEHCFNNGDYGALWETNIYAASVLEIDLPYDKSSFASYMDENFG